jgi:hypothetical protein
MSILCLLCLITESFLVMRYFNRILANHNTVLRLSAINKSSAYSFKSLVSIVLRVFLELPPPHNSTCSLVVMM